MSGKHTPGPWFYGVANKPEYGVKPFRYRGPGHYDNAAILSESGETIVGCDEYDIFGPLNADEREANARLIAEAGTVAHETGLTPRQLAEQRAELLELVGRMVEAIDANTHEGEAGPAINPYAVFEAVGPWLADARAAIAKATGESE